MSDDLTEQDVVSTGISGNYSVSGTVVAVQSTSAPDRNFKLESQ